MARVYSHLVICLILGFILSVNLVQCTFYNIGVKYSVTLDVYSGRDDPSWEIDESSPIYNRLSWAVNSGPPTDMSRSLGYKGFIVQASNFMGQTAWKTVGRHTNQVLESLLVRSCPSSHRLSKSLLDHVNTAIIGQHIVYPKSSSSISISGDGDENIDISIRHQLGRRKRQATVCSVRFAPENWNYAPVQRQNNCYNYATNIQTNTFAQPGRGSGQRYTRTTARNVYAASVRDGLTPLSGPDAGTQCLIALVIWPGEDYHFLRLDNDGTWSQKSGRTRARNVDDSGNIITDPRTADVGPYRVFGGWLGVGPSVTIR